VFPPRQISHHPVYIHHENFGTHCISKASCSNLQCLTLAVSFFSAGFVYAANLPRQNYPCTTESACLTYNQAVSSCGDGDNCFCNAAVWGAQCATDCLITASPVAYYPWSSASSMCLGNYTGGPACDFNSARLLWRFVH